MPKGFQVSEEIGVRGHDGGSVRGQGPVHVHRRSTAEGLQKKQLQNPVRKRKT